MKTGVRFPAPPPYKPIVRDGFLSGGDQHRFAAVKGLRDIRQDTADDQFTIVNANDNVAMDYAVAA